MHTLRSQQRQVHVKTQLTAQVQQVEVDAAQPFALDLLGAKVGTVLHAVANDTCRRCRRHRVNPRVVGIEHGDSVPGQLLDELLFRLLYAFDGTYTFEVNGLDAGDHANARPRQTRQQTNVADAIHGHFEHGDLVRWVQSVQDRHRQTDFRVEVAFALQHAALRAEHAGGYFLGRRLTEAAGDADDVELRVAIEGVAGHLRQGLNRRWHDDPRLASGRVRVLDQRSRRPV